MFLEIFAKKYGSFSPKIMEKKKLSKSVSGYFKTKKRGQKVPTATIHLGIFLKDFRQVFKDFFLNLIQITIAWTEIPSP